MRGAGRRGGRVRGRGRGRRGAGRGGGRTRGRGGGRGRGRIGVVNDTSSSEEEFVLVRPNIRPNIRPNTRRIINSSSSSDSDSEENQLLCVFEEGEDEGEGEGEGSGSDSGSNTVNDEDRYPIGTKVRKHFTQGWFDGEVISIDAEEKLWKIRYSDGDCEELDKDHLIRHISYITMYTIQNKL